MKCPYCQNQVNKPIDYNLMTNCSTCQISVCSTAIFFRNLKFEDQEYEIHCFQDDKTLGFNGPMVAEIYRKTISGRLQYQCSAEFETFYDLNPTNVQEILSTILIFQ